MTHPYPECDPFCIGHEEQGGCEDCTIANSDYEDEYDSYLDANKVDELLKPNPKYDDVYEDQDPFIEECCDGDDYDDW